MRTLYSKIRRWAGLAALGLVLGAVPPVALVTATPEPAQAAFGISQRMGVDGCGLNTTARAQAFWNSTPYWNFGLYLGGSSASCPMNNASFVSSLLSMGWRLMPIWVGPQAPCSSFPSRFSSNTATAYQQGKDQAVAAYQRLGQLGMSTLNTPIIYDLENYPTNNASCISAVKSFFQGWTEQLHLPPAQKSGVYGSSCASGLVRLAEVSPAPDFITGADWDNIKSVRDLACIPSGYWWFNQRHKQYRGDHNETWNGVTISVDNDCSNAPVYPGPDALDVGQGCL